MDTKKIGDIAEACLLAALLKSGKKILIPFGEGQPYDFVFEENGIFKKVQCKTGRLYRGCIRFNMYSVVRDSITKKYIKKLYMDQVDYYGIYYPENDSCYLISRKVLPNTEGSLRLEASNMAKGALLAKDFKI